MIVALKYLSQLLLNPLFLSHVFLGQATDDVFHRQMRRAAVRISARQHLFPHH